MKNFILVALLIVFSVGAVAPSAFAFDCPMTNKAAATQEMSDDMPCHEPQNKTQHCEGVCFCLHLSINQAQLSNDVLFVMSRFEREARPEHPYNSLYSSHTYPLLRPPIQLS